jgi:hypothetical protein
MGSGPDINHTGECLIIMAFHINVVWKSYNLICQNASQLCEIEITIHSIYFASSFSLLFSERKPSFGFDKITTNGEVKGRIKFIYGMIFVYKDSQSRETPTPYTANFTSTGLS